MKTVMLTVDETNKAEGVLGRRIEVATYEMKITHHKALQVLESLLRRIRW